MGNAKSHANGKPGTGSAKKAKGRTEKAPCQYFIVSLKGERIQVVNADSPELKLISLVIRSHCSVAKESWVKNMTYSFKLAKTSKHCMIRLVSNTLLSLYQAGWDPLTPVDMSSKKKGKQTAICFRRRQEDVSSAPSLSHLAHIETSLDNVTPCLCLETYNDSYIGFHDVPNTVLNELVTAAHNHWAEGIQGVSMAVSSVIQDYNIGNHTVLNSMELSDTGLSKFIKMWGKPWKQEFENEKEQEASKKIEISIIACLAEEGYKLSMVINMASASRVFFFIKDEEDTI